MKFFRRVIFILIIMLSILSIKSFASTAKINIAATRLREENNTTSEILTNIYEDEEVEIVEELDEWIKVKYKKYTGYIKKEFVTIEDTKKDETKKEDNQKDETKKEGNQKDEKSKDDENQKDIVSNYGDTDQIEQNISETTVKQTCYLRVIPNFMSKQIQEIEQDTTVTVVTQMNNWVQIKDGIVTGWVLKTRLNLETTEPQVDTSNLEKTNTTKPTNTTNTVSDKNNTVANKTNTVKENKVENNSKNNVTSNTSTGANDNTNTNTNTNSNSNSTSNTGSNNTTTQSSITSVSKKGVVNVETANVRKEPSTSSKRIEFLDEGDVVEITKETEDWYKVKHGDIEGYVSKKLITIKSEDATISSRSLTEERKKETATEEIAKKEIEQIETSKEIVEQKTTLEETSIAETAKISANEVVEYAKKYLGCAYVVGGKTPETGFDCSGFTRHVYKNFGYSLSSVSYQQTSVGTEVARENLQPGDLILFYNDAKTKIGHTGIYVGNGDFIHAANPERGVVYDNINTVAYYDERFVTARRIVE